MLKIHLYEVIIKQKGDKHFIPNHINDLLTFVKHSELLYIQLFQAKYFKKKWRSLRWNAICMNLIILNFTFYSLLYEYNNVYTASFKSIHLRLTKTPPSLSSIQCFGAWSLFKCFRGPRTFKQKIMMSMIFLLIQNVTFTCIEFLKEFTFISLP